MHVGLGLPLVVPLLPVVTLNTGGARALKPAAVLKDAPPDTPVHYDSKLDKFDQRRQIFCRQYSQHPEVLSTVLAAVKNVSLYEFWWKYAFYRGKFVDVKNRWGRLRMARIVRMFSIPRIQDMPKLVS